VVQTAGDHNLSPNFHGRQQKARRNIFCLWLFHRTKTFLRIGDESDRAFAEDGWIQSQALMSESDSPVKGGGDVEMMYRESNNDGEDESDGGGLLPQNNSSFHKNNNENYFDDYKKESANAPSTPSRGNAQDGHRPVLPLGLVERPNSMPKAPPPPTIDHESHSEAEMSFLVGILWLFIITLGISVLSDILVDTIDGFAETSHLSDVFTSMVIVPFFSNVAEQVSAIIFAYRNEMDLCVGVTVGSAIQVASFVLPGCVIIGWLVDRSMTLYFHGYETVCLFLAVIVVAAVLQGGSTNWLVGATCVSVYIMIATGFWFHSLEDLAIDAETFGQNATRSLFSTFE